MSPDAGGERRRPCCHQMLSRAPRASPSAHASRSSSPRQLPASRCSAQGHKRTGKSSVDVNTPNTTLWPSEHSSTMAHIANSNLIHDTVSNFKGGNVFLCGYIRIYVLRKFWFMSLSVTYGPCNNFLDVTLALQAAVPQSITSFIFAKEYGLHPDVLSTV